MTIEAAVNLFGEGAGNGSSLQRLLRAAVVAMALLPSATLAQDYHAGADAYDVGDYAAALEVWLPLAEQGDAEAQAGIGFLYATGKGVSQDYEEAARWSRSAAEQGNAVAQFRIGFFYYTGQGVPQDYVEAMRWYRLAAEQGNAIAQLYLGRMYGLGHGVPQNYVAAHMWTSLAAAAGAQDTAKIQDFAESNMTLQDISIAEERARVCMASDFQDCD